ncbi:hypothetical protein [Methylobacterium platani]|uniref:Twin-arginine translocation pathway signal n=2 Tax=Methylobacterium platani TaxID=427683 RepID=A0A179S178_9HYPH|nr:hypothetical protein [Methylobacterium platani]KMO13351.1 hypothetical protein SQ03_22110 [Methylobacterium platani JCM 14648]OAS16650.1 hypothetical protein A5481_28225 [Methylobacterium platani]
MKRLTSRRAVLGAFAAASALPAGIGLANPGAGAEASPDAALLALAPALLPLLERAEAMGPEVSRLYEEADEIRHNTGVTIDFKAAQAAFDEASERNGYSRLWNERAGILDQADEMISPFISEPPQTLEGLLLKARFAAAMDYDWMVQDDVSKLIAQRSGVEVSW